MGKFFADPVKEEPSMYPSECGLPMGDFEFDWDFIQSVEAECDKCLSQRDKIRDDQYLVRGEDTSSEKKIKDTRLGSIAECIAYTVVDEDGYEYSFPDLKYNTNQGWAPDLKNLDGDAPDIEVKTLAYGDDSIVIQNSDLKFNDPDNVPDNLIVCVIRVMDWPAEANVLGYLDPKHIATHLEPLRVDKGPKKAYYFKHGSPC